MQPLLKVSELKEILNIGRRQAYELVKREDFPKLMVGNSIRIPPEGLENWLKQQAI